MLTRNTGKRRHYRKYLILRNFTVKLVVFKGAAMAPLLYILREFFMDDPSRELLKKALFLLANKYDLDEDSFFLVLTKDGKNPNLHVSDQTIIGELNIKSLAAFIVQAINQLCASLDVNPHVFIARYITGAFLEQDRLRLFDVLGDPSLPDFEEEDYEEEIFEEDVFDIEGEGEDEVIYVTNPDWDKVNN